MYMTCLEKPFAFLIMSFFLLRNFVVWQFKPADMKFLLLQLLKKNNSMAKASKVSWLSTPSFILVTTGNLVLKFANKGVFVAEIQEFELYKKRGYFVTRLYNLVLKKRLI